MPVGSFGLTEFVILFLIILILFGAKRIPDLFRAIGGSIKGFKKGIAEPDQEENHDKS
jgi:sec-independent protein translocase protein TatA